MDLMSGGELYERLESKGALAEDEAALLFAELCDACAPSWIPSQNPIPERKSPWPGLRRSLGSSLQCPVHSEPIDAHC